MNCNFDAQTGAPRNRFARFTSSRAPGSDRYFRCVSLIFMISASLLCDSQAQSVPSLVNYQGRLSNQDGSPLATADYQLSFSIYDATNGGNLIWGPQIFDGTNGQGHGLKIPVVQGYFNVMLGPTDTNGTSLASAFTNATSFVQITVGTNQPILPRQQILTAPYAFQAGNSAKLAGHDWSAVFGTNDPVNGKIAGTKLANGAVTAQQIAAGGIQTSNLADGLLTLPKLSPRQVRTNAPIGGLAASSLITATFSNPGFSGTTVPELTATLVTSGRPVMVLLNGGGTNALSVISVSAGGSYWVAAEVFFLRNASLVSDQRTAIYGITNPSGNIPPAVYQFIDFPPAGTNSYSIKIGNYPSGGEVDVINVQLIAFEL
jgi:hypothetical protein